MTCLSVNKRLYYIAYDGILKNGPFQDITGVEKSSISTFFISSVLDQMSLSLLLPNY